MDIDRTAGYFAGRPVMEQVRAGLFRKHVSEVVCWLSLQRSFNLIDVMEEKTYRSLKPLTGSDFQIVEGEPNIVGWRVNTEKGTYLGRVVELLFDPQTYAVRYLVIDLDGNGMNLQDKKVMIPIGLAHLHTDQDQVILPGLHIDQFIALPEYDKDNLGPELEVQIRSIIGSPAALRIEDSITEFDQNTFYEHHHFDKERFYRRSGSQEVPPPDHMMNRSDQ